MSMRYQGFTLVEAMIVVAIVAILTTIALPSYSRYVAKGRITLAKAYLNQARQEAQESFLKTGKYPAAANAYKVGQGGGSEFSKYYTLDVEDDGNKLVVTSTNKNMLKVTAKLELKTGIFTYNCTNYQSVCDYIRRIKD